MKRIENCFDSHVHWRATGDFAERISLSDLKTPKDILKKEVPAGGPWILGYGWKFSAEELSQCSRVLLDQWCAETPVALSMSDGHSLWVNTRALEEAGLMKETSFSEELCPVDEKGKPLGLLKEAARDHVLKSLPRPNTAVMVRQLMKAQKIFHDQGITHIRDVHMTSAQWGAAKHLEDSGLLKLAVEAFVFDEALSVSERVALAKSLRTEPSNLLRLKGVKIFLDGSLGSDTAAVSVQPHPEARLRYSLPELEQTLREIWSEGLEVAVHCIGDVASARACQAALNVQQEGLFGRIHFEHVEILQDETIHKMKELDGVCHLQPGHWLDDKAWLESKIGTELVKKSFPWRRLQEASIPFFFGSDSPLSLPGVERIRRAVEDAAQNGIPRLLGDAETFLSHPDLSWPSNTFSEFEGAQLKTSVFKSESL